MSDCSSPAFIQLSLWFARRLARGCTAQLFFFLA
jgi:hypothetical protein